MLNLFPCDQPFPFNILLAFNFELIVWKMDFFSRLFMLQRKGKEKGATRQNCLTLWFRFINQIDFYHHSTRHVSDAWILTTVKFKVTKWLNVCCISYSYTPLFKSETPENPQTILPRESMKNKIWREKPHNPFNSMESLKGIHLARKLNSL